VPTRETGLRGLGNPVSLTTDLACIGPARPEAPERCKCQTETAVKSQLVPRVIDGVQSFWEKPPWNKLGANDLEWISSITPEQRDQRLFQAKLLASAVWEGSAVLIDQLFDDLNGLLKLDRVDRQDRQQQTHGGLGAWAGKVPTGLRAANLGALDSYSSRAFAATPKKVLHRL
jgi:hypothetical protein